jgi:hypothetical protein
MTTHRDHHETEIRKPALAGTTPRVRNPLHGSNLFTGWGPRLPV